MRVVRVRHDTAAEQRTRSALLDLLSTFDLAPWTFTDELVIDEQAWPHSHPVLTLDAAGADDPEMLLAAFVHERVAAGRTVPPEVWNVIDRHPPHAELRAIETELSSPYEDRRRAAEQALAARSPLSPTSTAKERR